MVVGVAVGIGVVVSVFIVLYVFVDVYKTIYSKNKLTVQVIEIAKPIKHKAYDYWNDAGDGSGVNYVQMPDGSVRID